MNPHHYKFLLTPPVYRNDTLSVLFPKYSKCILPKFGETGLLNFRDANCLLAGNVAYEYIFISTFALSGIIGLFCSVLFILSLLTLVFSPCVRLFKDDLSKEQWKSIFMDLNYIETIGLRHVMFVMGLNLDYATQKSIVIGKYLLNTH